jgi:hypothetical protein
MAVKVQPPSAGSGSALARTAVKTSAYTAQPGDLVACDPTAAAFTVTLPSAPADKALVEVKIITATAPNAVTVACGGSDVYNRTGGATTFALTMPGHSATFQYDAASHVWTITQSDTPLAQLDTRYLSVAGGSARTFTGTGPGSLARGDSPALDRLVVKSRFIIAKAALTSTYDFPPRIRPYEPTRRKVTVRNVGATAIQVAYSGTNNADFNTPAAGNWTANGVIQPGQEFVAGADPRSLFARPNTRGDALRVEVINEAGVA